MTSNRRQQLRLMSW